MTDKFTGSCHCGKIKFEVTAVLTGAMACNCSICVRKGALMWFVPRSDLRLLTSPEQIATYTFHKHIIKHHFCPGCGIHPFGEAVDRNGNAMAAVNVRCFENIELENIPVHQYDGKSI